MKKYVVIDTNILVSALITRNENAPTVKILKHLSQNKIVQVYSSDIVKEYYAFL
ncbi:putative toxin-antitoxin system toxin component, PIN family [Treponema putidum]|uniref:putative toxin-antitoxin system toxin component, PIN family n=1 Tax=Treponema putidum TaxID=221027 RepID=UPI000AE7E579|nr:putative toxin-antitoxin system toxin component, PIN family [Treponema putidum]TWI72354.1 putative PIN family toxin of toxin-antitoxin system [Treponema putidum]